MRVKKAIVLAAGKGTRMGPIGQKLAKPMWPFFGLTFLDIQLLFLQKRFGVEKIYLNSHHLYQQLEYLNSDKVKIIYEPVLLDQGGGILNICEKYNIWNERIIINNADQFYFFDEKIFEETSAIKENVLFGLKVEKRDGYNKLDLSSNGFLKTITKNKETDEEDFSTYSGLALIQVEKQTYDNKPVSFFNSVANFKDSDVYVKEIEKGSYFDFGKLHEYYELCFQTKELLDKNKSNELIDLIKSSDKFKYVKGDGLNFSCDSTKNAAPGEIILDQGVIRKKDGEVISN